VPFFPFWSFVFALFCCSSLFGLLLFVLFLPFWAFVFALFCCFSVFGLLLFVLFFPFWAFVFALFCCSSLLVFCFLCCSSLFGLLFLLPFQPFFVLPARRPRRIFKSKFAILAGDRFLQIFQHAIEAETWPKAKRHLFGVAKCEVKP